MSQKTKDVTSSHVEEGTYEIILFFSGGIDKVLRLSRELLKVFLILYSTFPISVN